MERANGPAAIKTTSRWTGRCALVLAGMTGLVLVSAVSAWWRIGDQRTVAADVKADYVVVPPDIPAGVEAAAGIGCLIVLVAATVALGWASLTGRVTPKWWLVAVPTGCAGYLLAVIERTLTAGVMGANIGAGLAVSIFGPVVVALLLWSLLWALRLCTRPSSAG